MAETPNFSHTRVRVPRLNPVRNERGGSDIAAALNQLSNSIEDVSQGITKASARQNAETLEAWEIAVQAKAQLDQTGRLDTDIRDFELANPGHKIAHNFGKAKQSHDLQRGKEAGEILAISEDDRMADGLYQTGEDYINDQTKSMDEFNAMDESPEFVVGMTKSYMPHSIKMANKVAKYEGEQTLAAHRVSGAATINRNAESFYTGDGTLEEREARQVLDIKSELALLKESFPNDTDAEIASLYLLDLETDLLDDDVVEIMDARLKAIEDAGIIKLPEDVKRFAKIKSDRLKRIASIYNKETTAEDDAAKDKWGEIMSKQLTKEGEISDDNIDNAREAMGFMDANALIKKIGTDHAGVVAIKYVGDAHRIIDIAVGDSLATNSAAPLDVALADPGLKAAAQANPQIMGEYNKAAAVLKSLKAPEESTSAIIHKATQAYLSDEGLIFGDQEQQNEQMKPLIGIFEDDPDKSKLHQQTLANDFKALKEQEEVIRHGEPDYLVDQMKKGNHPKNTKRWDTLIQAQREAVVPFQKLYDDALGEYEEAVAERAAEPKSERTRFKTSPAAQKLGRKVRALNEAEEAKENENDLLNKWKDLRDSSDTYEAPTGSLQEVSMYKLFIGTPTNESLINLMRFA